MQLTRRRTDEPVRTPEQAEPVQESGGGSETWAILLVLTGIGLLFAAIAVAAPERAPLLLLLAGLALSAAILGLLNPVVAGFYFLVAAFFRLATPDGLLPVEPFLLTFVGLLASVFLWRRRRQGPVPAVGVLGVLVTLYIGWNIASMVLPHEYGPVSPLFGGVTQTVWRFILVGAAMPFIALLVGVVAFWRERAMRMLLLTLMGVAGYSAFVSIMQFFGPPALVWPSYIVSDPRWVGRAVGVANQPVVNGMIMVLGYLAAVMVASDRAQRVAVRLLSGVLALACCVGVYLTHTRVSWLCFVIVVALGVVLARGWRRGFVMTLVAIVLGVAANWSTFSSDDRSQGGVASASEIHDRLNMIVTSLWAIGEKPWMGWGIGRFPAVNTYHHKQWSPSIPWERGHGFASHFDLLGIAVELGLVGAVLWLLAMGTAVVKLLLAARDLPADGFFDQRFALFALLALLTLLVTGLTVDLRFFDFPNIFVMLLAGAAIGRASQARRQPGEAVE